MQSVKTIFGRRSQPHQFIVARGEKVRSLTLPAWAVWAGSATCVAAIAWLVGSTIYITFRDDIYAAAKVHRIAVERAYEDRIATLRRQIDEINTRQFLDQQAFEGRLETLLRKQADLEERHQEIAGLFDQAKSRKVTIDMTGEPAGDIAGTVGFGLITTTASAAAFDPSRPAPLDPVVKHTDKQRAEAELPTLDRIQASIDRVATAQGSMLNALERSVAVLSDQLVEVSGAIGADLPEESAAEGLGGPLVELRRLDSPPVPDRQIERIRFSLDRFDTLREHVEHLPVRSPVYGPIEYTSGFGTRMDPFLKRPALHTGLDFRASTGTPVHATADGTVTVASYSGGYGRMVEIDHGDGYVTRYGHLSRIAVEAGDDVKAGTVVGLAGSTGRSTGPHLHYETRINGRAKDPIPFVEAAELLPKGF